MTRVAFLTLFLGLTLGPQRVALDVAGAIDHVELQLDGRPVAILRQQPWAADIDFGPRLGPHRLIARALDANGAEITRAEQKINVPRPPAEAQIVLTTNGGVRLVWQSIDADRPKFAEVLLDGTPLRVDKNLTAALPALDRTRPHLLRARLVSPSGELAEAELVFGGGLETQSGSALTAVPVRLLDPRHMPSIAEMQTWLSADGAAPHVVAIEELPGEVMVVRSPLENDAAVRLDPLARAARRRSVTGNGTVGASLPYVPSGGDRVHRLAFLWPVAVRSTTSAPADLFPRSRSYLFGSAEDIKHHVTTVAMPGAATQVRFADAVAVAGLQVMSERRPRAVVVLLGNDRPDESRLKAPMARAYLDSIGVPLFVWSLGGTHEEWGVMTDVGTPARFRAACEALQRDLAAQRIVWIEGDYLPGAATVTGAGTSSIELLGGSS